MIYERWIGPGYWPEKSPGLCAIIRLSASPYPRHFGRSLGLEERIGRINQVLVVEPGRRYDVLRCPRCLKEYRDGYLECADCKIPLMFGDAPNKSQTEKFPKLVGVLDTNDNFALASATTALSEAEIVFDIVAISDVPANLKAETPEWRIRPTRILVAAEDEPEARTLVEPFQQPVSDSQSESDTVSNGRSADDFIWNGSPHPTLVQRIAAWMLGSVFMGCGLAFFAGAVKDRINEGFSASVVIEAAFALAIALLGIRLFRNGFPRPTKQVDSK